MQQFRKGDIVSVEGMVAYHSDDADIIHVNIGHATALVPHGSLTLVRPNVQPEDKVFIDREEAVVIAVHEQTAWVKCDGSGHRFAHITDLKRKEAGEPA